ncbi:MAG: hypothetical protein Q9160_008254 [Pyrenula sp. 1 TL-2023]
MSFFPRFTPFSNSPFNSSEFQPLYRLFSEFDDMARTQNTRSVRSFAPRFDVRELEDGYHLDGELPGVDQKDIQIEFTDPHTLVIKGRTVREVSNTNSPAAIEDVTHVSGAIESGSEKSHQPTVEDETPASTSTPAPEAQPSTEVAKTQSEIQPQPEHKYWVSERSVGEFYRTFSFPIRVNQDAVKASLKNGILSVIVPKMKAQESRRINIE